MRFASEENRLNPVPPPDADESTVGGYEAIHGRAPTFEGADGCPYSVAIEVEHSPEPEDPGRACAGYFVFLRWSERGDAVLDHLETRDVVRAGTEAGARDCMEAVPLRMAKTLLDDEIRRKRELLSSPDD